MVRSIVRTTTAPGARCTTASATAKAFFSSEELHDAMSRAGVDGQPQLLWFGEVS
jgi:hypothetical protein